VESDNARLSDGEIQSLFVKWLQFGNDNVLEKKPVATGPDRTVKEHKPNRPPLHEMEPEHFIVMRRVL